MNELHAVRYRPGWPGLFAGENQTKALSRVIADLNASRSHPHRSGYASVTHGGGPSPRSSACSFAWLGVVQHRPAAVWGDVAEPERAVVKVVGVVEQVADVEQDLEHFRRG